MNNAPPDHDAEILPVEVTPLQAHDLAYPKAKQAAIKTMVWYGWDNCSSSRRICSAVKTRGMPLRPPLWRTKSIGLLSASSHRRAH